MRILVLLSIIAVCGLVWAETIGRRLSLDTGGDRSGRVDDDPELVRLKLATYQERTAPLVRHYEEHEDEPLEVFGPHQSAEALPSELAKTVQISDPQQRRDVLRRVAILGADLLRGERVASAR